MGVVVVEGAQRGGDVDGGDGGDDADRESAADLAGGGGNLGAGSFGCGEALTGGRQECSARCGEADLAAGAVEQAGAEFGLQTSNLVAEGGLNDEASFRGRMKLLSSCLEWCS